MLYPKKNDPRLSPELFKNPTCEYRGTPFWAWNCKLEEKELLRQIDVLREMGFGGFHMHVRSGMSTVYLGDEFMDLIESCVNKAKNDKMLAWLYDEDRWPSGFAGGYVTRDEQYRMRYLLFTPTPYEHQGGDAVLHANEQNIARRSGQNSRLIARFSIHLDQNGCLESYRMLNDGEIADGDEWFAYIESPANNPRYNGYTYVNTLDKKSIDRFIEVTHEAYKKKVGSEFGSTVPAIFTDEPQTTFKSTLKFATDKKDVTLPWTDDLDETYKEAYGFSLNERLPELFWELPDKKISRARYCYHDHIAERFTVAFAETIGNWCDKNGILLTGHVMKEPTLESQTQAVGEAMRPYRGFGMPGIDMLSSRHEYTTAKQAQSAVNQQGCEGMLDELYGVTTWDFDFRGHKLYGDWQAAMGVTVRVPHLSWVSMEGEAKRDYPASINYQSPWYKEYSYVEDHFARINTAMVRGEPCVRVGVIHPIESYWLHWGPSEQTAMERSTLDKAFRDVTEWLSFGSIDFDFICEANLPLLCEKGANPLQVGKMKYDAIVVPCCETLRSETLERLEAFQNEGGHLVFMGSAPSLEDALPSERGRNLYERSVSVPIDKSALLGALECVRDVELRSANSGNLTSELLYRMRQEKDGRFLFVGRGRDPYNRDIAQCYSILVKVKGHFKATLYDTLNGDIRPIPYRFEGNTTVIPARLYQHDSLLLYLEPSEEEYVNEAGAQKATVRRAIRVNKTVPFTLDEPNALLLDMARWSLDSEDLQEKEEILRIDTAVRTRCGYIPWGGAAHQPWYLSEAENEHVLRLRYEFNSEIDYSGALLAMENPEKATLHFNGERLSGEIQGYYTDKSIKTLGLPTIKKGTNVLEVEMPYGERSAAEGIFVLGEFGVRVCGAKAVITELTRELGFGDIVHQGLPFYSGKLTYHLSAVTESEESVLSVTVPRYRASVLRIHADGESKVVTFSPYRAEFNVKYGAHAIDIDAYIPRTNGFGPLHDSDEKRDYQSPHAWRTSGDSWSYEYNLTREGILSSPVVEEATT